MGESSSLVKAAMSVLVSRGGEGEAAAALWKLVEIWAGGRREGGREGGGESQRGGGRA
jgi:hypothetical protein